MKRNVRNLIVLLAALTLLTALLPFVSFAEQNKRYLSPGKEIAFTEGDALSQKAAELIEGKRTTEEKAMAIYSYIIENISYDYELYGKVTEKTINRYTPIPNDVLAKKTGISIDMASLYAAMCRSVNIQTKLVKGHCEIINGSHAWNEVYDESVRKWIALDITVDLFFQKGAATYWRPIGSGYESLSEV
ncbi:transglutaminase-like domain-containing protein [Eubacteriales bacterium OttesenSCG-928-K08]|nr:transglutaminase-like domain-containing protein [Eubacteriales bacterium OttesenSCG-928-K08]